MNLSENWYTAFQITFIPSQLSVFSKIHRPLYLESVQNCDRLRSYLQANKLACYSFMDAGRRYETPGSKTKNFITHTIASSMDINILVSVSLIPNSHRGKSVWSKWMPAHFVDCTWERNPESFIVGNKHICTLLQREPFSFLYWIVSMPDLCSSIL